jgi:hypothetical protein
MPIACRFQKIVTLGDVLKVARHLIGGPAPARITRSEFADRYATAGGIMFVAGRGRESRVFFSFETPSGPMKASAENSEGTRWTFEYPATIPTVLTGERATEADAIAELVRAASRIRAQSGALHG